MRYKLVVEYDGSAYHGWQIQTNGATIQSVLEAAVARLAGKAVRVAAAGRTDAGVHACGQVVSVCLERPFSCDELQRALNALTPADVAVRQVEQVPESFDPRRHASSRAYTYRIWNDPVASPFWRLYAWHVSRPLDLAAMQQAAAALLGDHDFTSFQAAGCDAEHPLRRVLRSELTREGCLVNYRVEANAFLRHMVRNIVGTLVEVGLGERAASDFPRLLASRDRTLAGPTAPPHGLCLTEVRYARRDLANHIL